MILENCRFSVPVRGRSLLWEVTRFCNLECKHCCTYSGPGVSTADDVDTERMVAVAAELADYDVVDVLFSGGEPFLRKDFLGIVEAIDPSRTEIYIASNGTTVTERTVAALRDVGVAGVDISIDGPTARHHRMLRLHSTSFRRAIRGIEHCVRGGIPLRVTSCVIPQTAGHVYELAGLLVNLGVRTLVVQTIQPAGGRAAEHAGLAVDTATVTAIEEQVRHATNRWGDQLRIDFRAGQGSGAAAGCPAGRQLLNISASGDVSTCSWLQKISPGRFTLGNIKQQSLARCLSGIDDAMSPWTALTPGCPIPEVLDAERRLNLLA